MRGPPVQCSFGGSVEVISPADSRNGSLQGVEVAVAHWHNPTPGGAVEVASDIAETLGAGTIYTVGTPPASVREGHDVSFCDVATDLSCGSGADWRG